MVDDAGRCVVCGVGGNGRHKCRVVEPLHTCARVGTTRAGRMWKQNDAGHVNECICMWMCMRMVGLCDFIMKRAKQTYQHTTLKSNQSVKARG